MKMKQKMFLGFIVLVLTVIVILAGCDNGNGDETSPNTDPKKIQITSFTGAGNGSEIWLNIQTSLEEGDVSVAYGKATVSSSNTLIFNLKNNVELTTDWTGNGSYYLVIHYRVTTQTTEEDWGWVFSNGITLTSPDDVPKYYINEATITIPFDKFFLFSSP